MQPSAEIIFFADRARRSLAEARTDGSDESRIAHLERAAARPGPAEAEATKPRPTDIEFPLRSIPKWVPAD